MKIIRCKTCVNDSTVKNISFDKNGVCNFCNSYNKIRRQITSYKVLEQNFVKRITKEKGKHRYDVALGISGGKDSTFVLYELVKKYNLNVYTYTLDNGFMSDEAKTKINKLVTILGVDHDYITCKEDLLKEMYRYTLKHFLSPCIACSYLGYSVMINITTKVDAAVGMHGRSRPQMFRMYDENTEDTFKPFVKMGLQDVDTIDFKAVYHDVLSKIDKYIDPLLSQKIKDELLADAEKYGYRDFIAYFLYHPYNKQKIIDFLEKETFWKAENDKEHFDCNIHNAAEFIKNTTARRLHILPELSVMVREGTISREEALQLAQEKNIPYPKKEFENMCKYADINKNLLLFKAKVYGKRWW